MLKTLRILIVSLFAFHSVIAQRTDLKLSLDTSVSLDNIIIHYLDGIHVVNMNNRIQDRNLILREPLYAPYARIQISQKNEGNSLLLYINEKPAVINILSEDAKDTQSLLTFSGNENVVNFYDTLTNPLFKQILASTKKENDLILALWDKHQDELTTNDSVKHIHKERIKAYNAKLLPVLKEHPNNYFSFSYFINRVGSATTFIKDEPDYFTELLSFLNNTFPSEFRDTPEGKAFTKTLENKMSPVLLNTEAPDFTANTVKGTALSSAALKGKYLLLDFWATWCPPCLQQIPDIKKNRAAFPENQLAVVSVSLDRDTAAFERVVLDQQMDWTHILDGGKELSLLFDVEAFPTLILIDPTGKIVYRKTGGGMDVEKIRGEIGD